MIITYGGNAYRRCSSADRRLARRAAGHGTPSDSDRINEAAAGWAAATATTTSLIAAVLVGFGVYLVVARDPRAIAILLVSVIEVALAVRHAHRYRVFRQLLDSGSRRIGGGPRRRVEESEWR